MLSIKNVLAELDEIGTLIFDEVDAGVSGRAAQKIGMKLKQVSRGKQILCVTHLAQIAAQADRHMLIDKKVEGNRTFTTLVPLDFEGRKTEIARIMGGTHITQLTLDNAEEMLHMSQTNP
jgi:DNA repair protein RecN (Recombination protein N)